MTRCAWAALLLAVACRPAGDAESPPPPPPDAVAHASPAVPAPEDGTPPDSALQVYYAAHPSILARGAPASDSLLDPTPNRHDPSEVDTLVTLRHSGAALTTRWLRFPDPSREAMLVDVTLAGPLEGLPYGIGVGSSDQDLLGRFGYPASDLIADGARTLRYEVGEQALDALVFRLRADRVVEIVWEPYLD